MSAETQRDHMAWARRPVSIYAVRAVLEGEFEDPRFAEIIREWKRLGVMDSAGRVVKLWDRRFKQFVPFGGAR